MMTHLTLLSKHDLMTQLLAVKRENNALKTVIIRQRLLCCYYEKMMAINEMTAEDKCGPTPDRSVDRNDDKSVCRQQIDMIKECDHELTVNVHKIDCTQHKQLIVNSSLSQSADKQRDGETERLTNGDMNEMSLKRTSKRRKSATHFTDKSDAQMENNCAKDSNLLMTVDYTNTNSDTNVINCETVETSVYSDCHHLTNPIYNDTKSQIIDGMCEQKESCDVGHEIHNYLNRLKCDQNGCNYVCRYRSALVRHVTSVHKLERSQIKIDCNKYKCDYCGALYDRKFYLNNHILTAHPTLAKLILHKCDAIGCKYGTYYKGNLIKHRKTKHPHLDHIQQIEYQTNGDVYNFLPQQMYNEQCFGVNNLEINEEIRVKEMMRDKPNEMIFQCDFSDCNLRFKNRTHLVKHRLTHRIDRFVCSWPDCGEMFALRTQLNDHYDNHTRNYYDCQTPTCDLLLANNGSIYTLHCLWPKCEYKTANQCNLDEHQKRAHLV